MSRRSGCRGARVRGSRFHDVGPVEAVGADEAVGAVGAVGAVETVETVEAVEAVETVDEVEKCPSSEIDFAQLVGTYGTEGSVHR